MCAFWSNQNSITHNAIFSIDENFIHAHRYHNICKKIAHEFRNYSSHTIDWIET